ncbi:MULTISPECIES: hypothetical protein [Streptomyces]|jgi:hypothetical protein|uniref:Uncharacterized protein n=1 Tax=Streptomyces mirabilis TaxID=68239 RepID=A0ABU3UCA5_9ACTN|nr:MULTISPECIES: hypothetical protein [Streptomyces]MCX4616657.1 hypothetical protein [Streptomyces mirabilis]MCX5354883.1 hypothetical protein [Streptomyces mirabilis]MDU8991546.1 hypothetical protein [Streptomyces mirabilis]QDN92675.1 hypothetical protein FNV61_50865 [Streptomyces sp. RLB3-6]QDO13497.1 hypothetical protein FNV68_51930 [Streptomyces sp. S1D4-23]
MFFPLFKALELKHNNTAYRPVMDVADLLKRHLEQALKEGAFFDPAKTPLLEGVVPEQWRAAVDDKDRVGRIFYELFVLVSLRDASYAAAGQNWTKGPSPAPSVLAEQGCQPAGARWRSR